MYQTLEAMKEQGYSVEKLTPTSTGSEIVWDSEKNQFVLIMKDKNGNAEYYTGTAYTEYDTNNYYKLWKIYTNVADTTNSIYSIYLADNSSIETINVDSVGFDAGKNTSIKVVNYKNSSSNAKNVVVRTSDYATKLSVNAENDTVKHYGKCGELVVTNIASNSYHEFGTVIYAELNKGRVVVEQTGKIEVALVKTTDAKLEKNNGTLENAYAVSKEVKNANTGLELTYETGKTEEEMTQIATGKKIEVETKYNSPEYKIINFNDFVSKVIENEGIFDGIKESGKDGIKVIVTPVSGCRNNTNNHQDYCDGTKATYATPTKIENNVSASYDLFSTLTNISISNVVFEYVQADFWICANSSGQWIGEQSNIKSSELNFMNNGNISLSNCTFKGVSIKAWAGSDEKHENLIVRECNFHDIYGVAINWAEAKNIYVVNSIFENVGYVALVGHSSGNIVFANNELNNIDKTVANGGNSHKDTDGYNGIIQLSKDVLSNAKVVWYNNQTSDIGGNTFRQLSDVAKIYTDLNNLTFTNTSKAELNTTKGNVTSLIINSDGTVTFSVTE